MIRATIHETEFGVLYVKGRFERVLVPGRHWILRPSARVERLDSRRRLLAVQSQEILTSDNVHLRLSAVVSLRVTDPARALHESESYERELYVVTQLALRAAVAETGIDDVLERKLQIGEGLLETVAARGESLGVEVDAVEIRDVMLPGERCAWRSPTSYAPAPRAAPRSSAPAESPRRCGTSPTRRAPSRAIRRS